MKSEIVYNILAKHLDAYRGANMIVRSTMPHEIVKSLSPADFERVRFIQLLSTPADASDLEAWAEGIPIDIVLKDPAKDFVLLYNYTNLLDTHPVRISIPVLPGVSKATKLAVSLNFGVKLIFAQPDDFLFKELTQVLDLYLHHLEARRPVEIFHTLFLSFYEGWSTSLWEIAEEDPSQVRYIADDGKETISPRFVGFNLRDDVEHFVEAYASELISEKRECHECEFFNRCGGYFKWPDKSYDCVEVKKLFATLKSAADELKQDLAGYRAMEVTQP